jgi:hypothetical protein
VEPLNSSWSTFLTSFLESGHLVKLQKLDSHGQVGIEKKLCLKFILSNQCWHVEVLDVEVGIIEIVRG